MKYMLNIPVEMKRFVTPELLKRHGEVMGHKWHPELHKIGWVEEVKEESAFEKWFSENYQCDEGKDKDEAFKILHKYTWQSSRENRDKIYKKFLELCETFLNTDFRLYMGEVLNNKSDSMVYELERIKKELNQ